MRKAPTLAILCAAVLLAPACRAGDGTGNGATGDTAAGAGVTADACPEAVNEGNGCIYLGTISDLTEGPFAVIGEPITAGQKAFWARVNADGGIGGFDIDVTSNIRDNRYDPELHRQGFDEIKGNVLALAQTFGSPQTAAILPQLEAESIVSVPSVFASEWLFHDVLLQTGAPYCVESMDQVDYAVDTLGAESIMHIHFPGDYGEDAKGGSEIAAKARGVDYTAVQTPPGSDNQIEAIQRLVSAGPDVVLLTVSPVETAVIVGQAAARGYEGMFLGSLPTWNPALLQSDAAAALAAMYKRSAQWHPDADTPGHRAAWEALGDAPPNEYFIAGWTLQYPLKAALERAVDNGDLTREGLLEAARSVSDVDFEGILPPEAGNFTGDPNEQVFREVVINAVDEDSPTGLALEQDFFAGPTAQAHEFTAPCFA